MQDKLVYFDNGTIRARGAFRENKVLNISRPLDKTDSNKFLVYDGSANITLTVPLNVFSVGTEIELLRWGSGNVSVDSSAGVLLKGKTAQPYTTTTICSVIILKQIFQNEWLVLL